MKAVGSRVAALLHLRHRNEVDAYVERQWPASEGGSPAHEARTVTRPVFDRVRAAKPRATPAL